MTQIASFHHTHPRTRRNLSVCGSAWLAIFALLVLVSRASAQTVAPPPGRTGAVFGQIANGTADGKVPAGLALMLHAWDDKGETVMLDGKADESGAFRFDPVPMQDGWVFAAMLSYNDVTFFSQSSEVAPETTEIGLPLTLYETTPDASAALIAQLHVFLDFGVDRLKVSELYVLSNAGDRAIVGGTTLAGDKTATLQFALPPGANEVRFEDQAAARFVITPEGFADTGAVPPGTGTAQVMVSYILPYASGMKLTHPVNYPVEASNVLMRADSGVALAGEGLSEPMPRQAQTGETYSIYEAGPLAPGDSLALMLTGKPVVQTAEGMSGAMSDTPTSVSSTTINRWAIPMGVSLIALALIASGVWLWRRSARAEAAPEAVVRVDEWSQTLRAIAALDEAHERSEVAEDDYHSRRAELREKAKAILQAKGTAD